MEWEVSWGAHSAVFDSHVVIVCILLNTNYRADDVRVSRLSRQSMADSPLV